MWNGGGCAEHGQSQVTGVSQDTPSVLNTLLEASPPNLPPKLLLTTLLVWSRICSDSMCGEPLQRVRGFAQAPVEARDGAHDGGGAGTQTASVGLGGGRTMASANTAVCK